MLLRNRLAPGFASSLGAKGGLRTSTCDLHDLGITYEKRFEVEAGSVSSIRGA